VDFLARYYDRPPELIQVCADLSTTEVLERELRALADAAKAHPTASRRLLALTRDAIPARLLPNIIAQPAYEWLLMELAI